MKLVMGVVDVSRTPYKKWWLQHLTASDSPDSESFLLEVGVACAGGAVKIRFGDKTRSIG